MSRTRSQRGTAARRGARSDSAHASFRRILEQMADAAYCRDLRADRYDYMSPVIEELTTYTAEEFVHLAVSDVLALMHPQDRPRVRAEVARTMAADLPKGDIAYRLRGKDGRYRWLADRFATLPGRDGRPRYLVGSVRGIDALKEAEEALGASEQQYRSTVDSLEEAVHVVNADLRLVLVNRAFDRWCDRLGVPHARVGEQLFEQFPFLPGRVRDEYLRVFATGRTVETQETTGVGREAVTTATRKVPIVEAGAVTRVITVVRDITAQKRADEELRAAHAELEQKVKDRTAKLRALAARLNRAEEDERRRIARVLQDELQQIVAGARFTLSGLRRPQTAAQRGKTVEEVDAFLETTQRGIRSLCVDLHPPVLQEAGIAAALDWLADDTRQKFGLRVRVDADGAGAIGASPLRSFVFQAVRELLHNVAKHSGARSARVQVRLLDGRRLAITVQDAGRGFDPTLARSSGFGLFSIRERVEFLGGDMDIRSAPGAGATVTLRLPADA